MNFSTSQPKVIVIGSCSIDQIVTAERLPKPNEFVSAQKSEFFFGGKGANQAVGMSRLGGHVYFIGCVGMDPAGQQIMRNLVQENVNAGFVTETDIETTGSAFITKTENDYSVVFIPAANQCLTAQSIDAADKYIRESDMVLMQLEISEELLKHAVLKAKLHHKTVGIYASPGRKIDQIVLDQTDFIIARSNELPLIFGSENLESILKKYANKLFVRDETNATVYHNGAEMKYQREENETMKYQIGTGDAFTCGFAYAFAQGNDLEDCVNLGNKVSAKVSVKTGAQTGLPYLKDLL